jgi:VWFA-related protein
MNYVRTHRGISAIGGVVALAAIGGLAFCQTPAPIVLRVSVRLIQVNVIAEDKDGKPVRDLKKEDFKILEQGQVQEISLFSLQTNAPSPFTSPDAASARGGSLSGNFFSNHVQSSPEGASSVTVILLDAINTKFQDLYLARGQVIAFLRQLRPQDQVALYLLTPSKLYTLHDFTNDSGTLVRLMGGNRRSKSSAPGDSSNAALDADTARANKLLSDALAESNRFYQGGRGIVEDTNTALRQIASNVVNIPGRKNLVWISDEFPVSMGYTVTNGKRESGQNFTSALSITAKILGDANVAVYPVDARGLTAPKGGTDYDLPNFDLMLEIASSTGGHAFFNTNGISGSIRKAVDDSRVSYLLGYYPANDKWDGKFRGIAVKVSRPGVHLRYRSGYYADAENPGEEIAHSRLIWDAIRSPLQLVNLGLEVQAEPITTAGGRELNVQIRVAGNQMHFEHVGDRWTDTIDVVWVGISSDGRVLDSDHDIVGLRPAQAGYDEIQQKGFSFSEHVKLGSESVEMRLIVRDHGTGAIGSVNVPLTGMFAKPGTGNSQ